MSDPDAVVVGAGPNGLAAAVRLAQAGARVLVLEAAATHGGGCRSAPLTRPGYLHDVCSAVHPLARLSPFFRSLALERDGLEWIQPEIPLAHPFDDGPPALLCRSVDATADALAGDGPAYRRLIAPLVEAWQPLATEILGPILHVPRHPLVLARFGLRGIRSACGLLEHTFANDRSRALLAGAASHSLAPLESPATAAFALLLAVGAHAVGWPIARGGSQRIADALAARLRALGGEIRTHAPVHSLDARTAARAIVFDVTPRQLLAIAGERLPPRYRRRLAAYRYGPGVFKVDWALSEPIPWRRAECRRAGTVHVGGSFDDVARSERQPWVGEHPDRPFVVLSQPTLFDPSRAPAGGHIAWAYCHVPHGSTVDMTERIERQIERFAPGFRETILARHTLDSVGLEARDPNLIGGDIAAGANTPRQIFFRPVLRRVPYATPAPDLWIASASTPPGGGVHGMCGYHAANAVLRSWG